MFVFVFSTEKTFAQSASLFEVISGTRTSFRGNISYFVNGDLTRQGKISYSYPNKIYIKFANGDEIVSNGKYLWLYDSTSLLCAKQEVSGSSFAFSLETKPSQVNGNRATIFSGNQKITILSKNKLPVSVLIQRKSEASTNKGVRINFSNMQSGVSINQSLFFYKPPTSAQVIENPFKKSR